MEIEEGIRRITKLPFRSQSEAACFWKCALHERACILNSKDCITSQPWNPRVANVEKFPHRIFVTYDMYHLFINNVVSCYLLPILTAVGRIWGDFFSPRKTEHERREAADVGVALPPELPELFEVPYRLQSTQFLNLDLWNIDQSIEL